MITELDRTPLLSDAGRERLRALREHPHAPRFNYAAGDRLEAGDLPWLEGFRGRLAEAAPQPEDVPSWETLRRVQHWRRFVPAWRKRLPEDLDLEADWLRLPTMDRQDLAEAPWSFVPDDEDLSRLVIFRTAGTTGHPVAIPHHPRAMRCYEALVEKVLARWGAPFQPEGLPAACFLLGCQLRTYTYCTVLSAWGGAGFAKINLRALDWPTADSPVRYLEAFRPPLWTGDGPAFLEAMRRGVSARPQALIATSVELAAPLREAIAAYFQAPVIDWYSMVETGPLAYACPKGEGLHLVSSDYFVEILNPQGGRAAAGEVGEITATGGRNPYLALVRYRTGDFAALDRSPCACGDPQPRLVRFRGRAAVRLVAADGTPVTPVDLSRVLREFPLVLHQFIQRSDRSCELRLRPAEGGDLDLEAVRAAIVGVVGPLPLRIEVRPDLGQDEGRKVSPYVSKLPER